MADSFCIHGGIFFRLQEHVLQLNGEGGGSFLNAFREQVLYLKHNLNSAAIASIEGEVVKIEDDVSALIAEMEKSITEADEFLKGSGRNRVDWC